MHEVLVSEEEMLRAVETDDYFVIYQPGKVPQKKKSKWKESTGQIIRPMLENREIIEMLKNEGYINK